MHVFTYSLCCEFCLFNTSCCHSSENLLAAMINSQLKSHIFNPVALIISKAITVRITKPPQGWRAGDLRDLSHDGDSWLDSKVPKGPQQPRVFFTHSFFDLNVQSWQNIEKSSRMLFSSRKVSFELKWINGNLELILKFTHPGDILLNSGNV